MHKVVKLAPVLFLFLIAFNSSKPMDIQRQEYTPAVIEKLLICGGLLMSAYGVVCWDFDTFVGGIMLSGPGGALRYYTYIDLQDDLLHNYSVGREE